MAAYFKSSDPCSPILNVSNLVSLSRNFRTKAVIKLLSNPPDNKHAIGLSVVEQRFSTALIK